MPVATYTTINGMLVHESRGGVESFYFPDTLGNLTTVRSATGVKTYGAEYWPYGEIQTETGTNPSPWSFVGLLGYLRDTVSRLYVRARHYRPGPARWQTVDPLWPSESAYVYVRLSPILYRDPAGLRPEKGWERGWLDWLPYHEHLPRDWRKNPWDRIPKPPDWFWPAQPAPGGGIADYNASGNFFEFGYGKCCGFNRQCNGCDKAPGNSAIDCLDIACANHDGQIPDGWTYLTKAPHSTFCRALKKCSCAAKYPAGKDRQNCEDAQMKMIALYCAHAVLL